MKNETNPKDIKIKPGEVVTDETLAELSDGKGDDENE